MCSQQVTSSPDDIDITALWAAVLRNKTRLALTIAGVGAASFLLLSMVTPKYESETRILIENNASAFTRPEVAGQASERRSVDPEAVLSQVQVLMSRDLAASVADKLMLAKQPEFNSALRENGFVSGLMAVVGLAGASRNMSEEERVLTAFFKKLNIYRVDKSRVIAVNFRSSNPKLAAEIANNISTTYIKWQRGERLAQNKGASKWLGGEIKKLRRDVVLAEQKAGKFRAENGLLKGRNNVTLSAQQLSELNTQLGTARARRSEAEARAKLIKSMIAGNGNVAAAPDVIKSALIQRLLEQRVGVQRQLSELSATLLSGHPRMRQLRSELSGLKRQIRAETKKIVASLQSEARIASAREASLIASLNELKSGAAKLAGNQVQLGAFEREAKSKRELLESYLSRYGDASARRDVAAVPTFASIISRARSSAVPAFPKKGPISLLAMVATLLLGLAFIVTRELLVGARSGAHGGYGAASRHDYRRAIGGFGAPPNPARAPAAPITIAPPMADFDGAAADATAGPFVTLERTAQRLALCVRSKPRCRTIVTGAEPTGNAVGEAVELARILSRSGKRVIIVDWAKGADSLAEAFDLERTPGIGELMDGQAGFEDVIRRDPASDVHLIPAGSPLIKLDSVAEAAQLDMIFDALAQTYDHVMAYAEPGGARKLYALLDGRFDAAVLVADHAIKPGTGEGAEFPGILAPQLERIYYMRAAKRRSLLSGLSFRQGPDRQRSPAAANGA